MSEAIVPTRLFQPRESGYRQVSAHWWLTRDGDLQARAIFQRHYSCSNSRPQNGQFVGPGEKMVLIGGDAEALFVWRKERFRRDQQEGVNCAVFRNEGRHRSSDLIREASELAHARWPGERLFTFVNASAIRSSNPGCCFKRAGWRVCGTSQTGLLILEL
jgi:hypothetical protein